MLCFSWIWLGETKIHTRALPDYPRHKKNKQDDTDLIKDLHGLFDEADILIAHNGDKFDIRKAYARFITTGLKPPSPSRSIDTLKSARKHFMFESNKLADLGQLLKVGAKVAHPGFDLWLKCMETDDPRAWGLMRRYNRQDVVLLKGVYDKLRPYMATHPNLEVYAHGGGCPACQSAHIQRRGVSVTQARRYPRFQCMSCGHWFRGDHETKKKAA